MLAAVMLHPAQRTEALRLMMRGLSARPHDWCCILTLWCNYHWRCRVTFLRKGWQMEKLIITVTVDSSMSYPGNPHMPPIEDVEAVSSQYVDAVRAGASIVHHHGVHYLENEIQPDGRRLSRIDFEGWKNLTELIRAECDPDHPVRHSERTVAGEDRAHGPRSRDDVVRLQRAR